VKRAAIQLCGHLRSYKSTYTDLFNKLVGTLCNEGYEADIFLHSWSKTDTSDKSWHNLDGDKRGLKVSGEDVEVLNKVYRPKAFLIEDQIKPKDNFEFYEKFMNMPRQYSAVINSTYTRYKVNELRLNYEKEHDIEYDYVIQTRPDIKFIAPFGVEKFLNTYKTYNFPVPADCVFCTFVPFRRGNIESDIFLCSIDLIIFAKPAVMNTINLFYKDIENESITKEWIIENCYSLEIMWFMYWKLKNLDVVKLKYFQFEDFDIIRDLRGYAKLPELKDASILKQEDNKKNLARKIMRKFLKIFPYAFVYKKIEKINQEIYRKF